VKKKKIVIHSNHTRALTGFGKHTKNLLQYLYNLDKYEIVEFANGLAWDAKETKLLPWKCRGTLPSDPERIHQLNKDPNLARAAGYGAEMVDQVIKEEKPDVYVGIEDIWGFTGYWNKKWWNKINCMVWTTLDSLPLLPEAVSAASKIKNYYVWANFAAKEMNRLGHKHVGLLRGSLNSDNFFRLSDQDKKSLRQKQNINSNEFLIGFVFRNQLRKSVPNLLEGYKLFIKKNPDSKAKLLFHTSWGEGWDIPRLLKEKEISAEKILTTYYCHACSEFEIKKFTKHKENCRFCGNENCQETSNVKRGVSEEQLNHIYNLMDVYCHPFTSGGQEIPIQEAKLTELVTLNTNYSCGEDSCTEEGGGFPLDWAEYREPGTQFIKASTLPGSICDGINKVFTMTPEQRFSLGRKARKFVKDNFSIEVIGKKFEQIIDAMPDVDWDYDFKKIAADPNYNPPDIKSNKDWLIDLYKNILKREVDDSDDGHKYWTQEMSNGADRASVLNYFKKVAKDTNKQEDKIDFENMIDKEDKGKRIAVVLPQAQKDVFCLTSILPSIKKLYPDHNIYFITTPDCFDVLDGNPYIHKTIPYSDQIDNTFTLEGRGDHEGYFDIAYFPNLATQRFVSYTHNCKDKTDFKLQCT
jgi:glycosyltransferase involved in cell wall biosynthesis